MLRPSFSSSLFASFLLIIGILAAALFLGIFLYTIKKRHTEPHYETLHK